jgi:hypothetical protein
MNNNSGGTCSTGDEMNNNLSNNKDPSEGMDLEVVVHVAQGIASCREGCGSGVRDGTDNTDCLPV